MKFYYGINILRKKSKILRMKCEMMRKMACVVTFLIKNLFHMNSYFDKILFFLKFFLNPFFLVLGQTLNSLFKQITFALSETSLIKTVVHECRLKIPHNEWTTGLQIWVLYRWASFCCFTKTAAKVEKNNNAKHLFRAFSLGNLLKLSQNFLKTSKTKWKVCCTA